MLDFMQIVVSRSKKRGEEQETIEIYPDFIVQNCEDLMIRSGKFYAIWMEDKGMWSTSQDDAVKLIDRELLLYRKNHISPEAKVKVKYLRNSSSGTVDKWHKYCERQMWDNFVMLDEKLTFANTEVSKKDYVSKRLPYPLEDCDISSYEKLISTLYDPSERHKIEWAIGAVVSSDSTWIQKFLVLYGAVGAGKSTILKIIEKMFDGYCKVFDAKALGSSSNQFSLEAFRENPLVAIQHDGDLSRIEDNTRINSLVSHEDMLVNVKFEKGYSAKFKCFLFMGTNKPVKITDAKSGLIRRLIDVAPSGRKLPVREYNKVMKQIDFELGGIAKHCLDVYLADPEHYDDYIPLAMLGASNSFYNFMLDNYCFFKKDDGVGAEVAWKMYRQYVEDAQIPYPLTKMVFREELRSYFRKLEDRGVTNEGSRIRNYYSGFRTELFENDIGGAKKHESQEPENWLQLGSAEGENIFDRECADCPAQYAVPTESADKPERSWDRCKTRLTDLDTSRLHYVKVPENLVVIDFDIRDDGGGKSLEKNIEAACKWPPTYAEVSKSGAGIHLHYIYTGDANELSRLYDENIEIKVFVGKASLRRKLSLCCNIPIATISSGLPFKEAKKTIDADVTRSEKGLRTTIKKCLEKGVHPGTKPNMDYIYKLLDDYYKSGEPYDVTDLQNSVIGFAAHSTHHADYCLNLVNKMHFKSDETALPSLEDGNDLIVFFDIEIFPNLFLVCYKAGGDGKSVVPLVNPTPEQVEALTHFKLVGFNCRRYDNHMLYAAMMGYSVEQLYKLSQKIITTEKGQKADCFFSNAYNISYTDVYDFAAKKQSLKKWEIELGIHHQELGLPWDRPAPEELWPKIIEYCTYDVLATEAVFNHLKGDFVAREILADLAGGTVNDTTNSLTTKLIFGNERKPQLIYTDLATGKQFYDDDKPVYEVIDNGLINSFQGYEFKRLEDGKMHNLYRGTDIGFGGYIFGNPGMYGNIALLDVNSLHPTSIIRMRYFGDYTDRYENVLGGRLNIKYENLYKAKELLGEKAAKYLSGLSATSNLATALKIALNSCYGLTSAKFPNPMRHPMNANNIVALRGALFMRTLQDEVESRGYRIVAIRTDSIKIADATPEIVNFCLDFAKKYGYTFEFEALYDRMCQVDKTNYIARYKSIEDCQRMFDCIPGDNKKHPEKWTVTGDNFAQPYLFKTLFSHEPIVFKDLCSTFEVKKGDLYLDMNESLPDVSNLEAELSKLEDKYKKGKLSDITFENEGKRLSAEIEKGHNYQFVGRVGQFCPILHGRGGGVLYRTQNGKHYAASGTTGYRWLESEIIQGVNEDAIDISYFTKLVDDAVEAISQYGDFEWFVSDDPYIPSLGANDGDIDCQAGVPCGDNKYSTCYDCPNWTEGSGCDSGYQIKENYMNKPEMA